MSHEIEPLEAAEASGEQKEASEVTRRTFLKGVGATAGVIAAGVVPAFVVASAQSAKATQASVEATGEAGTHEDPLAHFIEKDDAMNYPGKQVFYADPPGDQKWAMVIDVNACVGCRRCVYACVKENNISRDAGFTYIQVLEMETGTTELEGAHLDYKDAGKPDKWYMPVQCMQCAEPTCVRGCPVNATWKEPDGIVVIDYNKCISCKNCLVTCPYEARHCNWLHPHVPENEVNKKVPLEAKAGVIEKCTFCIHRVRNGQTTKCVEACPVGARTFGDLNDPESAVSQLIKTKHVFRLKEELGNEPMIWYVG
jgi:molybdopterin-containing oxidoreductase family iron-sulfur binding subunit